MSFAASSPYIAYHHRSISDAGGNGNGLLDPGETVDLVIFLRNYGLSATDVQAELLSDDPYITIHDGNSDFGDMASGVVTGNDEDPFCVEAAASVPPGHMAGFTVVSTYAGGQTTSHFSMCIGKYHYLVWDPSPDGSSGPVITSTLASLGYTGGYLGELPIDGLDGYLTLFVSCGVYESNYVIGNGSPEALALVDFIESGGGMYLEGADTWAYDPGIGGYNFGPLFGIHGVADGTGDMGRVIGQNGTFTEGMDIDYAGENSYMDHLAAVGSGVLIFTNNIPVYGCAVANDTGYYRTVGTSFEFGGLVDGASPSTKADLADAIMRFLAPALAQDAPAGDFEFPAVYDLTQNGPNPFGTETTFQFAVPKSSLVRVGLYDVAGRCVQKLIEGWRAPGLYTVRVDGRDLRGGIYFLRSEAEGIIASRKCVVMK